MCKKKNCDVFYVRNLISLFFVISLVTKKKINHRILYLNFHFIEKEMYKFFKSFLFRYFDEIKTLYFKREKSSLTYENKIKKFFKNEKNIKQLTTLIKPEHNKYEFINIYSGGDDFHLMFKKSKNFFYLEHGIGNYRDGLIFRKKNYIKYLNFFLVLFSNIGFNKFYLKKFNGYQSVLSNKIKSNITLNNFEVKYFNVNYSKVLNQFNQISELIKKKNELSEIKNIKNIAFINIASLRFVNSDENSRLCSKIISKIDKKDFVILKKHPKEPFTNYDLKKKIVDYLKTNKIKFKEIKTNFVNSLPLEVLINFSRSNKLISGLSSSPLFCSVIFNNKKFKNYMLLDYSLKYPYDLEAKRNIKIINTIKKKFKNIIYI